MMMITVSPDCQTIACGFRRRALRHRLAESRRIAGGMALWSAGLLFSSFCLPVRADTGKVELDLQAGETLVTTDGGGRLLVNVREEDIKAWKSRQFIRYRDLGAKGDSETDDIDAIAATHAVANRLDLPVKADADATYHIGGGGRTAVIQTDVDFGKASFVIDDTDVRNRNAHVFLITSRHKPIAVEGVASLNRNQQKLDIALPGPCLVMVRDENTKRHIRLGANQNDGAAQVDVFLADEHGNVDPSTPIIWDFNQITTITAMPVDPGVLSVTGGRFTTIANRAESKYTYYKRGIGIRRSNVVIDGIGHFVTGEGHQGAPYGGFIDVGECANVTVRNAVLTARRTYITVGSAGVEVPMGSYDINVNRAVNVSFVNVRQSNDINDRAYWGIMGSNYSKNLLYDRCVLSRFDAHMGVTNATIRDSTLGHMGVQTIGTGTFVIERSTIHGTHLIALRSDYGSSWQGEFVIRDSVFIPQGGNEVGAVHLIGGRNTGRHDFGYVCHMPERILMENLRIDDARHHAHYRGPAVFANFNPHMVDESYKEEFPYTVTREVILRNVTTASGKPLKTSDNPFMFRNVRIDGSGR
jgi:hypothetical protein